MRNMLLDVFVGTVVLIVLATLVLGIHSLWHLRLHWLAVSALVVVGVCIAGTIGSSIRGN